MIRPGVWRREFAIPLQSIQVELNRLFDEYWRPLEPTSPAQPGRETIATEVASAAWTPAIDLWESPHEVLLVVDLPGVDPAQMSLSLAGNVLTLRGEKQNASVQVKSSLPTEPPPRGRVKERLLGTFHREIILVEEVDFDRIEAQSKQGVLTVRLPKRQAGPARTILIQPLD